MGTRASATVLAVAWILCVATFARPQDSRTATRDEIAAWVRDLTSETRSISHAAYERLRSAGPEVVPALAEVVRSGTEEAASRACMILAFKGEAAAPAVPAIEDALATRGAGTGAVAAEALWLLRARPERLVTRLESLATLGEPCSAALLWRITGKEGNLRRVLETESKSSIAHVRFVVADILEEFGRADGRDLALRLAEPLSKDTDPWVRAKALCVYTAAEPAGEAAGSACDRGLEDPEAVVRYEAARGLAVRGLGRPGVARRVFRSLRTESPDNRLANSVVSGVVKGAGSVAAVDRALAPARSSGDSEARRYAVLLVWACGGAPEGLAEAAVEGLSDPDPEFRRLCCRPFVRLKGNAAASLPALRKLFEHDADSRREAAMAMAHVGAASIPAFVASLENADPGVRRMAAWALGLLGPAARESADALRRATRDADPLVAEAARGSLAKIESR